MATVTVDSNQIWPYIAVLIVGLVLGACFLFLAISFTGHETTTSPGQTSTTSTQDVAPVPAPAPVATTVPTPVITPFQQYVTTFTVASTTLSNGRYQVQTYDGRTIDVPSVPIWNTIIPRGVYVGTVTGTIWGEYQVSDLSLLSRPNDRIRYYDGYNSWYNDNTLYYYEWDNEFWQCDQYSCDPIQYKQAKGENIIHDHPRIGRYN